MAVVTHLPQAVPSELRAADRWIVWRSAPATPKPRKIPVSARTGLSTDWQLPESWASFADALACHRTHGDTAGVGFVLGNGWAGVDLDNCIGPAGIATAVYDFLAELGTYSEVSPSGAGIKAIGRFTTHGAHDATHPELGAVELYESGRWFAVTGRQVPGLSETIGGDQTAVDRLLSELRGVSPNGHAPTSNPSAAVPVPVGRRNAWLTSYLGTIRDKGATEAELLALGRAANTERLAEPLDDAEVCGIVRSLLRYAPTSDVVVGPSRPAPVTSAIDARTGRPELNAGDQDLHRIVSECWERIESGNKPERWFRRGGIPHRLERGDDGQLVLRQWTADRVRIDLAQLADWVAYTYSKQASGMVARPARPPMDVMRAILAAADPALPVITRFVQAPTYAPDWTLQTTPGYCAAAQVYHAPSDGVTIPEVPDAPTPGDVAAAKALIEEAIGDFRFVADADRAHAYALMIEPFVRTAIAGPTPIHDVESPMPGTGKGLLVQALLLPSLGTTPGVIGATRDDDELRKSITSRLMEGHSAIWLDNANHAIASGVLAAAVTAPSWSDRVLGSNTTINLPVQVTWALTANNPTFTTENLRRAVRIRLDANEERPWLRTDFRHPDLLGWARSERGRLIWAALTLVQNWMASGKPTGSVTLGSFEAWAGVMGGILGAAGIPGFLANREEFYEQADTEATLVRMLVKAWAAKHGTTEVKAADLFTIWTELEGLDETPATGEKPKSDRRERTRFGMMLTRYRDRVIEGYRIAKTGKEHSAARWRLQKPRPQRGEPGEPGEPFSTAITTELSSATLSEKGSQGSPGSQSPELEDPSAGRTGDGIPLGVRHVAFDRSDVQAWLDEHPGHSRADALAALVTAGREVGESVDGGGEVGADLAAQLLTIGAELGWPRYEYKRGTAIVAGEPAWRLFAERAYPADLVAAVDAVSTAANEAAEVVGVAS